MHHNYSVSVMFIHSFTFLSRRFSSLTLRSPLRNQRTRLSLNSPSLLKVTTTSHTLRCLLHFSPTYTSKNECKNLLKPKWKEAQVKVMCTANSDRTQRLSGLLRESLCVSTVHSVQWRCVYRSQVVQ